MTKRTRRTHSLAVKAKVALAAIKSEKTLADLAKLFEVSISVQIFPGDSAQKLPVGQAIFA